VSRAPVFLLAALLSALACAPAAFADETELWSKLRSGEHVALLRHARAPGTGDPEAFALRDCATQRNLSEDGRQQAKRIGERLRDNGVGGARVYSSQWCRCLDTARLLGLGAVEELAALNSFYQRWDRRAAQTRELTEWLMGREPNAPTVLVTHQVNISAIADVYPAEGALAIVRVSPDGTVDVAGTIATE
jgi:broad specificity phosphatase PhoE